MTDYIFLSATTPCGEECAQFKFYQGLYENGEAGSSCLHTTDHQSVRDQSRRNNVSPGKLSARFWNVHRHQVFLR